MPVIFDTPLLAGGPEHVKAALATPVPISKRLGHPADDARRALGMITNDYFRGEDGRLDGAIRMAPR